MLGKDEDSDPEREWRGHLRRRIVELFAAAATVCG
jgi:hypothetical protein